MNKTITIKLPRFRDVRNTGFGLFAAVLLIGAVACTGQTSEEKNRNKEQEAATIDPGKPTLEQKNLDEKTRREENPNAIQYVYLVSFGKVMGYYVVKGKISNNGSQKGPEDQVLWTCKPHHDCMPVVVDGKQDDGSYGDGDPGIFFFTTEGIKVVTDLDYMQSDQPLPFNVPKLNPAKS